MTALVGYLLLFLAVGAGFILVHLLAGKAIRPDRPSPEKATIYECGEPTIGSAWVQFDLRFYVVALLFVIFDVEVAFFFPWAVVFGRANTVATTQALPVAEADRERYNQAMLELVPPYLENAGTRQRYGSPYAPLSEQQVASAREAARQFGWIAFGDLLVFFGVLLVGFAYLWKRGDLDWVRSVAAERAAAPTQPVQVAVPKKELVASGS